MHNFVCKARNHHDPLLPLSGSETWENKLLVDVWIMGWNCEGEEQDTKDEEGNTKDEQEDTKEEQEDTKEEQEDTKDEQEDIYEGWGKW